MRGVTLLEMLIVLVVASLLATIAVPAYRNHVLRAHRLAAMTTLLHIATAQEKFHFQHGRYATHAELELAPPDGLGIPAVAGDGRFDVAVDVADAAAFTASAQATGLQLSDRSCARFTLDSVGLRTAMDGAGLDAPHCWR